jgi:hypothetical protein
MIKTGDGALNLNRNELLQISRFEGIKRTILSVAFLALWTGTALVHIQ